MLPESFTIPAATLEELSPAIPLRDDRFVTWVRSNGDDGNSRYGATSQINRDNVVLLQEAWVYQSDDGQGNIQCNPVIVDGVIYAPTVGHDLVAISGRSGEEIWRFKAKGRPAHRGLVYWPGDGDHVARLLLHFGQTLWAIDPATGKAVSDFGDKGSVETGPCVVAGAVYKHVLVLPGYNKDVWGIDVRTGERLWTFHTIPQPGEYGYDTWRGQETGANSWGGMALDGQRGMAYIATGSPKPNFFGMNHKGSNLFANCVLALDALTGKYRWHFQEIRHDIWDLDIPASPNLVNVERDGKLVDAVAQVTKIGNTLVLDRETGKPLYPVRFRRAPVSGLPGESTWPYQPDIQIPEPFARQEFTAADVTTRTSEAQQFIAQRVASANHGWFQPFEESKATILYGIHGGAEWTGAAFDPVKRRLYVSANELPWVITVFTPERVKRDPELPPTQGQIIYTDQCATCHGPHRQGGNLAPPLQGLKKRIDEGALRELLKTGRNLMPVAESLDAAMTDDLVAFLYNQDLRPGEHVEQGGDEPHYSFTGFTKLLDQEGYPGSKTPWGTLNCINLDTGKIDWKVPLGQYPALAEWGETDTGAENFGGAMVTGGGLVFCGGTPDQLLRAFDSDTGEELWQAELPWGGYAPPATYTADGKQYILIAATGGGKLGGEVGDAWVAFSLPD